MRQQAALVISTLEFWASVWGGLGNLICARNTADIKLYESNCCVGEHAGFLSQKMHSNLNNLGKLRLKLFDC